MAVLDLKRKLAILSDAAKYDASCASSSAPKRNSLGGSGVGSTEGMGICHAYAPDGRCISLADPGLMRVVRLASEIDFDGWRVAARALRTEGVAPERVFWSASSPLPLEGGEAGRGGGGASGGTTAGATSGEAATPIPGPSPLQGEGRFCVPRAFVHTAQRVILHRWPQRFALLYRLLWRLKDRPRLMEIRTDPDVALARDMTKEMPKLLAQPARGRAYSFANRRSDREVPGHGRRPRLHSAQEDRRRRRRSRAARGRRPGRGAGRDADARFA